jgi:K+-transporting ATPase ATPase C chain
MKALRLFLWLTLLLGVLYPLSITAIATLTMPKRAKGSLVKNERGEVIGSLLIGQSFTQERYFWPRPSATNYNPLPSAASNLGATSKKLLLQVEERKRKFANAEIPSDLLFASASGLDPHISLEAALFQVDRVARARGMQKEKLEAIVRATVTKRKLFFLGQPCVNVLQLNLKLDSHV